MPETLSERLSETGPAAAFFSEIIGHEQAIALLCRGLARNQIAPAYLFLGAEGIGRSRVARCFAQVLLSPAGAGPSPLLAKRLAAGNHPDVLWVEPTYLDRGNLVPASQARAAGIAKKTPPQIRLDQVRQIARFLARPPLEADRSIVILDGAETMGEGAANGLLKTLEEPGAATLILLAPSADRLLSTIVSRCARLNFQRLTEPQMRQVLQRVDRQDLLDRPALLALAQGSPGAAIDHWDYLEAIPEALVRSLLVPPRSRLAALELAQQVSSQLDPEAQRWLVAYLQQLHWQDNTRPIGDRDRWLRRLETVHQQLTNFIQPRLVWEVALLDWAAGFGQ